MAIENTYGLEVGRVSRSITENRRISRAYNVICRKMIRHMGYENGIQANDMKCKIKKNSFRKPMKRWRKNQIKWKTVSVVGYVPKNNILRLILKTNDNNGHNGSKIQKQIETNPHTNTQWFLMSNDMVFTFVCFAIRYSLFALLCVFRLWFHYWLCSVLQLSFFFCVFFYFVMNEK